jgi:RHS repeat-associated protein
MRRLGWVVLLAAAPLFATYTYYFSDTLTSITSNWTANGVLTTGSSGLTSINTNGGSLISNVAVPAPSNQYEVKTTLTLTQSGGSFITYLRASSNAQYASGNTGTYYAVVLNPTFSGSTCTASFSIVKSVVGVITVLTSGTVPCRNGMVIRSVYTNNTSPGQMIVYFDTTGFGYAVESSITGGQPGIGVSSSPAGNSISRVDLGPLDTVAPQLINSSLVGTSIFPDHVDMQWPGVTDNTGGTGIAFYQIVKNGAFLTNLPTSVLSDPTLSPGTTYTYYLGAADYHLNYSWVGPFTVTTPPAGSIDPRQVGVRPMGTYWGSGGEQIDMRSGNLNYTVPLIKTVARGGWSASFNLSYNSQNWRKDPGGTWELGRDVGYGYGWRLQAGSLTPEYRDYFTIDHYLFIDATGAEYRLTQNTGGVWSSTEGIYVFYDSNTGRLYFRDGSFWNFGSLSAGAEQDAGTLYPTQMQDANGNFITIAYDSGSGLGGGNSSARITQIADVRSTSPFTFSYSAGHLTGIATTMTSPYNYNFTIASSQPLNDPFAHSPYGTTSLLQSLKQSGTGAPTGMTTSFAYDTSGSGEMTQMTTPYGGHIRWGYGNFTYNGTRTLREVSAGRFLAMSAGATELQYSPWYSGNTSLTFHDYGGVDDADGVSEKSWNFQSNTSLPGYGLASYFEHRPHHYPAIAGEHSESYFYATSSSGNTYLTGAYATEDNGNPTAQNSAITQIADQYGNITQKQIYGYSPTFPLPLMRTYNYTYLSTSNYTSRYIFNRMTGSSVSGGGQIATLSTILYDSGTTDPSGGTMPMHDYANYGTGFNYRGNPYSIVKPSGTTSISYDVGGNVLASTTNGVTTNSTTETTYYTAPHQISTTGLTGNNTLNFNSYLGLDSASGVNGDTSSFLYDTSARPTTTTSPTGAVTTYAYNDTATPPTRTASVSGTGINTHWTRTTMDGFGRSIKTEAGYGALTNTPVSVVDTVYIPTGSSPLGKTGKVSQPYAPGGTVYWTTYAYDGLGRTTSVTKPDTLSATHYSYSGNTVTTTDPAGKYKTFSMDKLGKLIQVQEPDPTLGTVSTYYTYDVLGHLAQVSMPRGSNTQTRTFNYAVGSVVGVDLLSATNPENGTVTYTYNSNHTLATKVDANGVHFSYGYDGLNRPSTVSVGGSTVRWFAYDSNTVDPTYSHFSQGRLTTITYPQFLYSVAGVGQGTTVFTEMFDYSKVGQVLGKRLRVNKGQPYLSGTSILLQPGVGDLNMVYAYNAEGKLTSVTYPTDASTGVTPQYNYSYDNMMRPAGLTDQTSATLVSGVNYGPANEMLQMIYNGGTETRTYNNMLQLTHLSLPGQIDINYNFPSGTNNGKLTSQTDNISGETVSYLYDSLNRLIQSSSGSYTQTYSYDGFGNLTNRNGSGSLGIVPTPADPATNRLTGASYDLNGNMLSTGNVYDTENHLSQANAPGGIVRYVYDGKSKRIWQGNLTSCGTDWCLAYGQDSVSMFGIDGKLVGTYTPLAPWSGTSTPVTISFWGLAKRVYFAGKLIRQGVNQNVVEDRLGSVSKYYPYGEDRSGLPNDQVKFATYTRDAATGLDYADHRYYSSAFGRFMTPDPYNRSASLGNPTSWNRFTYVLGDPANKNDPRGLCGDGDDSDCEFGDPGVDGEQESFSFMGQNGGLGSTGGGAVPMPDETPVQYNDSQITGSECTDAKGFTVSCKTDGAIPTLLGPGTSNVASQDNFGTPIKPNAFTLQLTGSLGALGALVGEGIAGPAGVFPGYWIGSMFGLGPNISDDPSTGRVYLGPSLTFSPSLGGGNGASFTSWFFPGGQDPDATLRSWSGSVTFQPTPISGSSVTKSPGQPPVAGYSVGTRVPVALSGGYSWCLNCP